MFIKLKYVRYTKITFGISHKSKKVLRSFNYFLRYIFSVEAKHTNKIGTHCQINKTIGFIIDKTRSVIQIFDFENRTDRILPNRNFDALLPCLKQACLYV